MKILRITRFSTAAVVVLAGTTATAAAAPRNLEFAISKASNPDGKGAYTGAVSFNREDEKTTYKVTWKLAGGVTYTGHGVASGDYMAVAYGSEAVGVGLYKVNEKTIEGTWAPAKVGAVPGIDTLKRGKVKYQYVPGDGSAGTVTVSPTEVKNVANVKYDTPDRKFGGIGLMDGDYVAVGGATGLKDFGVVIYRMNKDLTASGKWIVGGATSPGTEDLKLLTIDGKPAHAGQATAEGAPAKEKEMNNADLAKLIALDFKKCAVIGKDFIDQMKLDDMNAAVGLIDDRAFDAKDTREKFTATIGAGRKALGKMKDFAPDKKKTDFKAAPAGMLFSLEGDGSYENANTREVLTFLKPKGEEKVVMVGYVRSEKK